MKRKKAFTLLELMVTISIFLLLSVLISAILIQGQTILTRVDNSSTIQNEVRTALLKIQTEAQKADEVIINNKFGAFYGDKWILNDSSSSARELLRVINNEEDSAKVYVEVNDGDKHQLVEFIINNLTNEIVNSSKNVLISNIEGNDANTISLNVEEINDSKGNKINELVTINCSNIIRGSKVNENEYLITFTRSTDNTINIEIGQGNETEGVGNGTGDVGMGGSNDEDNNIENDNSSNSEFENNWEDDWERDGIIINYDFRNQEWVINIQNNSEFNIWEWEVIVTLSNGKVISYYNGNVENLESNSYKIYTNNFYEKEIKKGATKELKGQMTGQSGTDVISDIKFRYKRIKEPNDQYVDAGNGVSVKLTMLNQWDGTAQWIINIRNNSNVDIEKWELVFGFEKIVKNVGWGLKFENLENNNYSIKNYEQNILGKNREINIAFESDSGVVDRNLKNIKFNIIN